MVQLDLDKDGFLKNHNQWNKQTAIKLAAQDGLNLTDEHWQIIMLVRQFYQQYHTSPAIRVLVKALKQQYGLEKGNSLYLQSLFPKGAAKQVARIAGLPKPVKCT